MRQYLIFGLKVASEIPILLLSETPFHGEPDVEIRRGDLRECFEPLPVLGGDGFKQQVEMRRSLIMPETGMGFEIREGKTITVDIAPEKPEGLANVYLLGCCMGTILTQRGIFALHGSCVYKDGTAILITGDSGAGKSTLASEFLKNGWKLMTDDVAAVSNLDTVPLVQSSYPSRKLWLDAIQRMDGEKLELTPLWQEERREKFNVNAAEQYLEGSRPLKAVIRLYRGTELQMEEVNGFTKADQLMRNVYGMWRMPDGEKQRLFQRCVTLSQKVRMMAVLRREDVFDAPEICRRLSEWALTPEQ